MFENANALNRAKFNTYQMVSHVHFMPDRKESCDFHRTHIVHRTENKHPKIYAEKYVCSALLLPRCIGSHGGKEKNQQSQCILNNWKSISSIDAVLVARCVCVHVGVSVCMYSIDFSMKIANRAHMSDRLHAKNSNVQFLDYKRLFWAIFSSMPGQTAGPYLENAKLTTFVAIIIFFSRSLESNESFLQMIIRAAVSFPAHFAMDH